MEFFAHLNEFYQMGKKPGGVKNLDVENSEICQCPNLRYMNPEKDLKNYDSKFINDDKLLFSLSNYYFLQLVSRFFDKSKNSSNEKGSIIFQ